MKQSLDASCDLEAEVRRLFHSFIEDALQQLNAYPETEPEGLHEARKDIKKLRSLLRLIRHPGFKKTRKELNAELRNSARLVSAHRDKEVLQALFRKWQTLERVAKNPELQQTLATVQQIWGNSTEGHPVRPPSSKRRSSFTAKLRSIETRFEQTALDSLSTKHLSKQLTRSRKQMNQAYRKFKKKDRAPTLHALRKRTKDCCYQLKFLKDFIPSAQAAHRDLKIADDHLGQARDSDLAIQTIGDSVGTALTPEAQRSLLDFVSAQRHRQIQCGLDKLEPHL